MTVAAALTSLAVLAAVALGLGWLGASKHPPRVAALALTAALGLRLAEAGAEPVAGLLAVALLALLGRLHLGHAQGWKGDRGRVPAVACDLLALAALALAALAGGR